MNSEMCPECDGVGSIDVEAGGPSGQWTSRVHPVGFGYQNFAFGQVWEASATSSHSLRRL